MMIFNFFSDFYSDIPSILKKEYFSRLFVTNFYLPHSWTKTPSVKPRFIQILNKTKSAETLTRYLSELSSKLAEHRTQSADVSNHEVFLSIIWQNLLYKDKVKMLACSERKAQFFCHNHRMESLVQGKHLQFSQIINGCKCSEQCASKTSEVTLKINFFANVIPQNRLNCSYIFGIFRKVPEMHPAMALTISKNFKRSPIAVRNEFPLLLCHLPNEIILTVQNSLQITNSK